ncbi:MAG: hypothetical protein MEP57_07265 [Microvirga sp.]|nr:hypothetical protein [Microvirga sp.]
MARENNPAAPFDPMAAAPAMMNMWRMAAVDLPLAWALHMNACMKRMVEQQTALMVRLADARDVDDVTAAQVGMVEAAIDEMEESAASLARDVAVTLETSRAN